MFPSSNRDQELVKSEKILPSKRKWEKLQIDCSTDDIYKKHTVNRVSSSFPKGGHSATPGKRTQYNPHPNKVKTAPKLTAHYENTPMQYSAIFHGYKNDNFQMKNCDIFFLCFRSKIRKNVNPSCLYKSGVWLKRVSPKFFTGPGLKRVMRTKPRPQFLQWFNTFSFINCQ